MAGWIPVSAVAGVFGMVKEQFSSAATGEATSFGVGKVTEHVGYICDSTENVKKMKDEAKKLKTMRRGVKKQIKSAKRKGDDLVPGVQKWVKVVNADISKAEGFLVRDVNRYRDGKRAAKMYDTLVKHQEIGKVYEACVSVDTPTPGPLDVYENKNLDDILTQNSALVDIIAAVEDESKQIIGIYGIGGVGKTTLAMEVSARVNHLFAAVAFTTVSQTINEERIRKDIGEATKRIMKGEKVLIILDDVWEILDLQKLCIPCGINHMNCKILLTSRSEFVCERMNAHSICVNALPKKEAWILFKRVVGDGVETDADMKRVAMKVADECGGLPLFLKAVGNALKAKSIEEWETALKRLQNPATTLSYIDPEIRQAYTRLRLSYDLHGNEVQSCFLLCCMFPEDAYILLETLVYYAVGLGKLHGLESIDEARQRVADAVKILTSSGLLLNLEDKSYTKMHDVVRDVALLIASQGQNNFLVKAGKGLTKWLPRNNELESYTGISLMNNNIPKLPNYEINLPHLEIFLVSYNPKLATYSEKLFKGMQKVKVLDMGFCNQSWLRGFQFLTKVRVLNLMKNIDVVDISILGEMKDLEILILNDTGIKEIPKEIGELVNLRRLEGLNCHSLKCVAEGVISNLWRLEELLISLTRLNGGIDDRIVEVMNLSKLTYLYLAVPHFDVIPEGLNFGKLKLFTIEIGGSPLHVFSHSDCRLVIKAVDVRDPLLELTKKLIPQKPATILDSINNIKNIMPDLSCGGFNEFEHIVLKHCLNVSSLVDEADGEGKKYEKCFVRLKHLSLHYLRGLETLWHCSDQYISLGNLVTLYISCCDKLVRLFSVSIAQTLINLQNLRISECKSLEEVIWDGDEETNKGETVHTESIIFHSLAKLNFYKLYKLERFYSGYCTNKYPSLVNVEIEYCSSLKIWGPGIHEAPKLKFVGKMPLDGPDATINDAVAKVHEAECKRQEFFETMKKQRS